MYFYITVQFIYALAKVIHYTRCAWYNDVIEKFQVGVLYENFFFRRSFTVS